MRIMTLLSKMWEYIRMFMVLLPAVVTKPKQPRYNYSYNFSGDRRYLAIGFDDFRITDFSIVIPLFEKYGFKATFNKITLNSKTTWIEILQSEEYCLEDMK